MLYRTVEKTGDRLSILGFGCMRLPQKRGQPGSGKIDDNRAQKQIRYAIDRGVNYIDTAMPYHAGGSEPFLGRALRDGYREKVKLATKLPPWSVKSREDMDQLLRAQKEHLNTDHIDYYLLHALERGSWEKMKNLGALEFLEQAKADGRIGNAGFSFHGDLEVFKEIVDAYDWTFCQIQYNYLDEQNQAGTEGLRYAAEKQLAVIVMEPLRGGNLARPAPPKIQALWDRAETGRTPVEWALRWVWNHPEVTVVLSGMNEDAHIEENLSLADEAYPDSLTGEELRLVKSVEETYRELSKAGCTGCRYCMPCPSGVDIPMCFEIYNRKHLFNDAKGANIFYLTRVAGAMGEAPSLASLCEHCGKCEKACPQHLPIQELLEDVSKDFEGWTLKLLVWATRKFFGFQRWSNVRKAQKLEKRKQAET
ncbi:MAG: aldo/keto reductase [Deltaproteobacteria bacterium]|nr:aldo/keto reductase [Deltaproteobacteria bacterium]